MTESAPEALKKELLRALHMIDGLDPGMRDPQLRPIRNVLYDALINHATTGDDDGPEWWLRAAGGRDPLEGTIHDAVEQAAKLVREAQHEFPDVEIKVNVPCAAGVVSVVIYPRSRNRGRE